MRTHYRCTECGAEDSDTSATPALAIICWKCKAGHKMSISDQVQAQYGMLVTPKEEEKVN